MCLNKAFRRSLEFIVLQFYSLKKNSQGVEPLYHKGYNPAQSIESSVPIPKIKTTNRYCTKKTTDNQIPQAQVVLISQLL
jgi:hypothetical protein